MEQSLQPYGYIYITINLQTKLVYVGESTDFKKINKYLGSGRKFNKIKKEFDKKFFKKIILGFCYSKEELEYAESICIEHFDSTNILYGYNLMKRSGVHGQHSEETIKKLKIPKTEEQKANMKKSWQDNYEYRYNQMQNGLRNMSQESKEKQNTGRARPHKESAKEKIRIANLGKKASEETKAKHSANKTEYWKQWRINKKLSQVSI